MFKIGVLADTHIRKGSSLPSIVWESLLNVDLILHAGDVLNLSLLEELKLLAPIHAVKGNCDGWELADLPSKDIFEYEGIKFGLIHGNNGFGKSTPERALNAFKEYELDIIVFGHSHIPYANKHNNILLFNPGSPTDKRRQTQYSIGFLEINKGEVKANHLFFD